MWIVPPEVECAVTKTTRIELSKDVPTMAPTALMLFVYVHVRAPVHEKVMLAML